MLKDIEKAYEDGKQLEVLFQDPYFNQLMVNNIHALREVVSLATKAGIPTPTLSASMNYLESIFDPSLPANLIQGQRDYFGAHTYERTDKPAGEMYHYSWYEEA